MVKAFTLNPIDVELYVEQMPGMEVAGDWLGATKRNTVCFLHKCLEGLKQAGNIWQTTHSGFLNGLDLPKSHGKLKQSTVEALLHLRGSQVPWCCSKRRSLLGRLLLLPP